MLGIRQLAMRGQQVREAADFTIRPRIGTSLWLGDRGALSVTATVLDTFLTPTLFLRYGRKPLERLVAQVRSSDQAPVGGTTTAKPLESF